jgi:hypothetical protein
MDQRLARRRARATVRLAVSAAVGIWIGCSSEDDLSATESPAPATGPESVTDWGRSGKIVDIAGIQAPRRAQDDGTPDTCQLIGNADPRSLLGQDLAPARRVYGLCLVEAAGATDSERSIGLEIRRDPPAVSRNLDEFWEREGGGVAMLGSGREQIEELREPGDYALWFPIEGGLQLFSYWDDEYVLVLTVRGVPTARALPWARDLARRSVAAAS